MLCHTSQAGSPFALAPSYPNIQWGMSSLRLRNDGATRGGRGEGRRDGTAERNIVIWIHFGAILNPSWPPNLPVPPIFWPRPPSLCFLWGAILIMARETLVSPGSEGSFQHITTDGLHYTYYYNLTSRLVVSRFPNLKTGRFACVRLHLQFERRTRWCGNVNVLLWQPKRSRHHLSSGLSSRKRGIYTWRLLICTEREKEVSGGMQRAKLVQAVVPPFPKLPRRSAGSKVPMSDRRNPCVCFIKEALRAKDRWTDGVTEKREGVTVEILSAQRALLRTVRRRTSLLAFSPFPCRLRTCIYY